MFDIKKIIEQFKANIKLNNNTKNVNDTTKTLPFQSHLARHENK